MVIGKNEGEARKKLEGELAVREVTRIMQLLNQRYVIPILLELSNEELGFNELQRRLNLNANTLRARLAELENQGIIARKRLQKPGVNKAQLTGMGKELVEIALRIRDCENEWNRVVETGTRSSSVQR